MLMFWVGGFFSDEEPAVSKVKLNISSPKSLLNYLVPTISLSLLLISFFLTHLIPSVDISKERRESATINYSSWGINFANALEKSQDINESGVESFHAIYANKQVQGELISWENVTHNHDKWTVVSSKELAVDGKPVMLVHLRSINGITRSYLYQYKVGDFYTVNENKAKLMQAWNSLTRQSDFSEVRAVSIAEQLDLHLTEQKLQESFKEIASSAILFQPILKGNSSVE